MPAESYSLHGVRVFEYDGEAPCLRTVRDATDVIGLALGQSATLVLIPIDRLDPSFFELRTGLAGEILQKFVNYRLRVAILGDYAQHAAASTSLRDFIRECNRGAAVWFLADRAELERRLLSESIPHNRK